ncbi:Forkhead-associated protein [Halothece sp. PCC 7418]|uniref:FHA domain-containing protein n=1 Tax=Halothece sp. (strain PCC 7418) TaxID=65093 RepID=UPI0002A08ACF|nr:FHA domain-containing protein [Halothece sp. PCC 7418]AFZ45576.1 Forkhead-associated protein [Halothece sp. PCC 7418]
MASKADKVEQTLSQLQTFLEKAGLNEQLDSLVKELTQIQQDLSQKQVSLQIVSQDSILAELLYNIISSNQTLTGACQINYSHLPDVPQRIESEHKGYLSLRQYLTEGGTESWRRYELFPNQDYHIGRDETCAIALPASHYRGISQQHATIRFVGEKDGDGIWELCDLNSRNGTFINGQQIKGSQQVDSGDKIHLGFPESKPQIAEFSFDSYFEVPDYSSSPLYWDCINCDFLVMVVNSRQPLTSEEENFLQKLDSTLIHKQLIVADIPSPDDPETEKLSSDYLNKLQDWLDKQTLQKDFDLITVCLQVLTDQDLPDLDQLPKSLKKIQTNFFKSLENLVKRQPENILAERLSRLTLPLLDPIDEALSQEEEQLENQLNQAQSNLESIGPINLKETAKKVFAEVNEDKDRFFKQVKVDFTRSKEQLLFLPHKDSVSYQLHTMVQSLDSIVLKKEGMCYIQLSTPESADSRDINQKLLKFICRELRNWAYAEWEKNPQQLRKWRIKRITSSLPSQTQPCPQSLTRISLSISSRH